MPGSSVGLTPGATVMRGGAVALPVLAGVGVALGAGERSVSGDPAGGCSGAASFFGWATT